MTHLSDLPPSPLDIAALELRLPADAYHHLTSTLRDTLPRAPDDPKDRTRRDNALTAQISAFRPADAAEAIFAAQIVAANQQWLDCLRWVQIHLANNDHTDARQCRAQAATMLRAAQSALRSLLQAQRVRRQLYADPKSTDAAERDEHITTVMLAEALADLNSRPEPPPKPEPPPAPPLPDVSPGEPKSRTKKIETAPRCASLTDPRKGTPPEPPPEPPKISEARRAAIEAFFYGKREYDPRRPSKFYPFTRGGFGLAYIPPAAPATPTVSENDNEP